MKSETLNERLLRSVKALEPYASVSAVARRTGLNIGTTCVLLKFAEQQGLVRSRVIGKSRFYFVGDGNGAGSTATAE